MIPLAFVEPESDPNIHGDEIDDFAAMQMMCSRICHDLSGPGGAVAAAVEIIGDHKAPDPEALQLIAESSRIFRGRLNFLRAAFGFGGTSASESSLAQITAIAVESLRGGRVQVDIVSGGPDPVDMGKARPADVGRLILCLISEAARGLPRGGRIEVRFHETRQHLTLRLGIFGQGARFPDDLMDGIDPSHRGELTSRNVSVYYLHKLLNRLDTSLDFRSETDREAIAVLVIPAPGDQDTRRSRCTRSPKG